MKNFVFTVILVFFLAANGWTEGLPKLVDLGADKCVPCIEMAPMLEKLTKDFSGKMDVQFIDVWKNSKKAAAYGVRMIPTQIFMLLTVLNFSVTSDFTAAPKSSQSGKNWVMTSDQRTDAGTTF